MCGASSVTAHPASHFPSQDQRSVPYSRAISILLPSCSTKKPPASSSDAPTQDWYDFGSLNLSNPEAYWTATRRWRRSEQITQWHDGCCDRNTPALKCLHRVDVAPLPSRTRRLAAESTFWQRVCPQRNDLDNESLLYYRNRANFVDSETFNLWRQRPPSVSNMWELSKVVYSPIGPSGGFAGVSSLRGWSCNFQLCCFQEIEGWGLWREWPTRRWGLKISSRWHRWHSFILPIVMAQSTRNFSPISFIS